MSLPFEGNRLISLLAVWVFGLLVAPWLLGCSLNVNRRYPTLEWRRRKQRAHGLRWLQFAATDDVRIAAHLGRKPDIAPSPKCQE
jgi:hypothetical protein